MTQRERKMLIVVLALGGFVLFFGGWVFLGGRMDALQEKDSLITRLETEQRTKEGQLRNLALAQRKMEQWKAIGMPPDPAVASMRYEMFLRELIRKHGLTLKQLAGGAGLRTPGAPRNALVHNQTYTVTGEGTLPRVISFLREFYSTNLAHQLKSVVLTGRGSGADARVELRLTVETLSLPNAPPRDHLMPTPDARLVAVEIISGLKHGPIGLGLGPWTLSPHGLHGGGKLASTVSDRDYTRLVAKNIFAGIQPVTAAAEKPGPDAAVLRHVHLTDITANFIRREANLWNRLTNRHIRLRAEGGFDSFEVRDGTDQVVLKGKVEHIGRRDVVFAVDGKRHAIHINESLHDALQRPLAEEEWKKLTQTPIDASP